MRDAWDPCCLHGTFLLDSDEAIGLRAKVPPLVEIVQQLEFVEIPLCLLLSWLLSHLNQVFELDVLDVLSWR